MKGFRTILSLVVVFTFLGCTEGTSVDPGAASGNGQSEASRYSTLEDLSILLAPNADVGLWLETSDLPSTDDLVIIPLVLANRFPVAGFQVDIEGGSLVAASGGRAENADFHVATHENGRILGFSYSADVLETGTGVVTELAIRPHGSSGEICLSGLIIADPEGTAMAVDGGLARCVPLN